jgi:hypothetical protein
MKKLLFFLVVALGVTLTTTAQQITIDSLTRDDMINIRNRYQATFQDSASFENDTILNIVKDINRQLRLKPGPNAMFKITVPLKAALLYYKQFAQAIYQIEEEERRAREALKKARFQRKLIRQAYRFELSLNVPESQSMFREWLIYPDNRVRFMRLINLPQ